MVSPYGGPPAFPPPQNAPVRAKPPRVLGVLLAVWGLCLSLGAVIILALSGEASPLVVGGPAILTSGVFVAVGRKAGVFVYFAGIIGMGVWMAVETGSIWQGVGRMIFGILIGLLLCRPKVLQKLR